MKDLKLVIDTNQFIFRFGSLANSASKAFINKLPDLIPRISIHIPRTIVNEVRNNLSAMKFKEFMIFIQAVGQIDDDHVVPVELAVKYASMGLKSADALIAAYTEWVKADMLVSENRHFLTRKSGLPFKVLTASQCLKLL